MNFLIPKNVRTRLEFFTGFGFRELGLLFAGLAVGGILFGLVFLLTKSWFSLVFAAAGGGAGFILGRQDPRTGMNALDFFKAWKSFQTKRKRYFYKYGDGR
ncbi:PrgI family mobile element protein [Paenibacillus validus]|uniref:PrgI family mobile element protein n=1 Tax=Paenibacillus validus TaxID=44253 RepID=UPI003D28584F